MHLYAIMLEVLLQELASVDAVSRPDQVPISASDDEAALGRLATCSWFASASLGATSGEGASAGAGAEDSPREVGTAALAGAAT
jgi:hypothetical protein